jgi:hypothetical protein
MCIKKFIKQESTFMSSVWNFAFKYACVENPLWSKSLQNCGSVMHLVALLKNCEK